MGWHGLLLGLLLLLLLGCAVFLVAVIYPVVQNELAQQAYCIEQNPGYECVKGWVPGRKILQ